MRASTFTAATLLFAASAALAGPVSETEVVGFATNNTIGTAQAIPGGAFTTNIDPDVFGSLPTATMSGHGGPSSDGTAGSDVDFFSFATTGGIAYFDIDNDPFAFDTILSLFDSTGTLIGYDDDSFPEDPGTAFGFDSFLGSITLPAGTYFITVSTFANFASASGTGVNTSLFRPDAAFGGESVAGATPGDSSFPVSGTDGGIGYTLEISVEGAAHFIPLPSAGLMGLAGMGLVTLRRRR
ncbi:MAG: DVUA0089 family protein [Phycisphaerales bacterium]|nr:DVUA0089 family protein [Phycisphaerales bacterium]